MIGIDTNVLIRYIVQDDPKQSAQATKFIEGKCSKTSPGFINNLVLCEISWVLQGAYGYSKKLIIKVLRQILSTAEFSIQSPTIIRSALKDFESGSGDFSDYLIARQNQAAGCQHTVTFDKKAQKHPEFKFL